jgi:hypothetical protein
MSIPWDKIPWSKIFEKVEKWLASCSAAGAPPEEQEAQLRNPSPRFRAKLERVTRRGSGLNRREWDKQGVAIMERVYREGSDATTEDIKLLRLRVKERVEAGDFDNDDDE